MGETHTPYNQVNLKSKEGATTHDTLLWRQASNPRHDVSHVALKPSSSGPGGYNIQLLLHYGEGICFND